MVLANTTNAIKQQDMKVLVSIDGHAPFVGKVIDETNSFYKVTWDLPNGDKNEVGEWFPKKSLHINCKEISE